LKDGQPFGGGPRQQVFCQYRFYLVAAVEPFGLVGKVFQRGTFQQSR